MSVTSVHKDPEQLALTVTADYDVSADRAWQLWADPRQLERWWGPSPYPALKSPLAPCRSCALAMRMSPQAEMSAQTPSSSKNPY